MKSIARGVYKTKDRDREHDLGGSVLYTAHSVEQCSRLIHYTIDSSHKAVLQAGLQLLRPLMPPF